MLAMDDPHPYDILQGVSVSDVNIDPGADAFLAYWSPKLPSSKLQPSSARLHHLMVDMDKQGLGPKGSSGDSPLSFFGLI